MQGHGAGGAKWDIHAQGWSVRCSGGGGRSGRSIGGCRHCGRRGPQLNEPPDQSTARAPAFAVVVEGGEGKAVAATEVRLAEVAALVIREDRAPLVGRFSLVHPELSRRNITPARWSLSDAYY